ncbi:Auxin-responsive protein SAUR32 [Carex littledalei]|uniref:Auxin-responsive protein SAUR32 n=1 Tax=Carex littledalei TaxID=544730 RepID=A0A833R6Z1_9POAL|nr:Auxin-responsive protein SAUR32 [Carex littledalei]
MAMRNREETMKPTKNGKTVPGVPVKPTTVAKICDFFRKCQNTHMADRQSIFRSSSDTLVPYVKAVYFDDNGNDYSTSEDESDSDNSFIYPDIPRGHFGVLVGLPDQELMRFVMPIKFLSLPPFQVMLTKSNEAYGFNTDGPLQLPVDANAFRYILQCSLAQYKDVPIPQHDCNISSDEDENSLGFGDYDLLTFSR